MEEAEFNITEKEFKWKIISTLYLIVIGFETTQIY